MCVYSMVVDHFRDKWTPKWPNPGDIQPYLPPNPIPISPIQPFQKIPTKEEIEDFYELLKKAKEYDEKNKQPDCEMESKKQKLLELAKELGIKIDFL